MTKRTPLKPETRLMGEIFGEPTFRNLRDNDFRKVVNGKSLRDVIMEALDSVESTNMSPLFKERAKGIILMRYGFEGPAKTYGEIGKVYDVSRERIRQIEAQAKRILRHPSRSGKLRPYWKWTFQHAWGP